MVSEFKAGDLVEYVGSTPELLGAEGIVTYSNERVSSIKITKGSQGYRIGEDAYPDTTNITLVHGSKEAVDHPDHYGGDTTYEVFKVVEAWGLDEDAYLFNVVKYVARAKKKGKFLEDLKKARVYIDRRIKQLEEAQ